MHRPRGNGALLSKNGALLSEGERRGKAPRGGEPPSCPPPARQGDPGRSLRPGDAEELAGLLKVLGDPVRLRILAEISAAGEICACELVGASGRTQPTVSHHLRALREAGLVGAERRGNWIWYSARRDRLTAAIRRLGSVFPPEGGA